MNIRKVAARSPSFFLDAGSRNTIIRNSTSPPSFTAATDVQTVVRTDMNALSYRTSDENGLSFELLVDGEPLGELVGARDTEIPYWIVGDDLPSWPPRSPDAVPDIRIVTVCSCGEYGCGHTCCRVVRSDDAVV